MGGKRQGGEHRGGGRGGRGGRGGQSNKRAKYLVGNKNNQAIPTGSRGILMTCYSGWEEKAGREMLGVIEEHYDKLAGPDAKAAPAPADDGGGDIAAALAAEVAQLKQEKKTRKIQVHETGVSGCIFFEFPKDEVSPCPVDVVLSVCDEACASKMLRGRHANRLLPVTHTCFASVDEIKAAAPKALEGHFPKDATTDLEFAVEYEHRSCAKFDRLEIINAFVDNIDTPPYKVNLKEPTKTILVQLTRSSCGVAVVRRYRELHKYNLRKCAEVPEEDEEPKDKQKSDKAQQKADKADAGKEDKAAAGKEEEAATAE